MKRLRILALASLMLSGCNVFSNKTWQDLYADAPLTFTAVTDSSDAIWERARTWFGGTLRPPIAILSDTLIQSAETRTNAGMYSIAIARSVMGKEVKFVVSYTVIQNDPDDIVINRAKDRAHELAYMAATSDTPQARLQRVSRKVADPIYDWHHP